MPPNMNVYRLPELFSLFAMVFGKLKDERDVMNERRMREKALANGATNEQTQEFTFLEKLEMFLGILQKCIVESGEKSKILYKLYDALLKVKIAYIHY